MRMAVDEFADFGEETFVLARQENLETIHQHNVVAERHGLLSDVTRELRSDEHVLHHVSMREWLEG
jgi:GTP cyclohydrolase I/GTP cyclohydrolase-4